MCMLQTVAKWSPQIMITRHLMDMDFLVTPTVFLFVCMQNSLLHILRNKITTKNDNVLSVDVDTFVVTTQTL